MGWADEHIAKLQAGETVTFRPRGRSMEPHIMSGQQVVVEPCTATDVRIGDIVLCKVAGAQYLHFVRDKVDDRDSRQRRARIGNAHGRMNGWTSDVFGRVTKIRGVDEDDGT